MDIKLINILVFLLTTTVCCSKKYAYVSVLSSNDFLVPAKVLAFRLRKLNPAIPYIIIVTEDITMNSRKQLEDHGVIVHNDTKIDTPYIKTHKARKYQYTKIRLWKMTEFEVIVHLDLDVLPTRDISTLFQCGTFCASFRHSDMFNSGVFVLKTNETIFYDMEKKVKSSVSYDGGDQGFLNTYFSHLKLSPMYDDANELSADSECDFYQMRTLSSKFNYDIGMYYLNNGRFLINPSIIHYTMGPTKPWLWWTYPLFDLNWIWLEARQEMESGSGAEFQTCVDLAVKNLLYVATLMSFCFITSKVAEKKSVKPISNLETHIVPHLLFFGSMWFSVKIAPQSSLPIPAWIFFSSNLAWTFTWAAVIYCHLRIHSSTNLKSILLCVFSIILCFAVFWMTTAQISHFNTRVLVAVIFIFLQQIIAVSCARYFIISNHSNPYNSYKILQDNKFSA